MGRERSKNISVTTETCEGKEVAVKLHTDTTLTGYLKRFVNSTYRFTLLTHDGAGQFPTKDVVNKILRKPIFLVLWKQNATFNNKVNQDMLWEDAHVYFKSQWLTFNEGFQLLFTRAFLC